MTWSYAPAWRPHALLRTVEHGSLQAVALRSACGWATVWLVLATAVAVRTRGPATAYLLNSIPEWTVTPCGRTLSGE